LLHSIYIVTLSTAGWDGGLT